jgi:hypothetical protein
VSVPGGVGSSLRVGLGTVVSPCVSGDHCLPVCLGIIVSGDHCLPVWVWGPLFAPCLSGDRRLPTFAVSRDCHPPPMVTVLVQVAEPALPGSVHKGLDGV